MTPTACTVARRCLCVSPTSGPPHRGIAIKAMSSEGRTCRRCGDCGPVATPPGTTGRGRVKGGLTGHCSRPSIGEIYPIDFVFVSGFFERSEQQKVSRKVTTLPPDNDWFDSLYYATEEIEYPKVRNWLRGQMLDGNLSNEDKCWAIVLAGRMNADAECEATDQELADDMNALVRYVVEAHGMNAEAVRRHFPKAGGQ